MKNLQNPAVLSIFALILVGSSGCQTARVTSQNTPQDDAMTTRNPATAANAATASSAATASNAAAAATVATAEVATPEDADVLIRKFVKILTGKSTMTQSEIEDAISSTSKKDFEDIATLSESDQKKVIDQLLHSPGFAERIAVRDVEALQAARTQAIAMADIKPVGTEAVADIRPQAAAVEATPADSTAAVTFEKAIAINPELKMDADLMTKENQFIQQKTGTSVLDKGCDSIQNADSVETVSNVLAGVQRDVASGSATDAKSVSKSVEKNMSEVLGTDAAETHRRVCALSDKGQCGVFTPQMCIE
jgi:hypothetical protein